MSKTYQDHIRALGIGQGTLALKHVTHRDPFEIARMERALSQESIAVPEGASREYFRSMLFQVADKKPELFCRDDVKPLVLREIVGWRGDDTPIYADDPACAVKPALMQKSIRDW